MTAKQFRDLEEAEVAEFLVFQYQMGNYTEYVDHVDGEYRKVT
jgi:hypothetical protein